MTIEVKTTRHNEYLEFVVTGFHDLKEAVEKFTYVLDVAKLTGLNKVLVDYRELIYKGEATEKALYAVGAVEQYTEYLRTGGQELQIAYLAPMVHTYEPGSEIGDKITSLKFKLFSGLEEAIEWLDIKNT